MSALVKIEVLHTVWGAGDDVYQGGVHEIEQPSGDLLRLLAGAEAAGAILVLEIPEVLREKLDGHVQSQADGEAAYAAAQESGRWQHGNLVNAIAGAEDRLAYDAELQDDDEDKLTVERRAALEHHLAQARTALEGAEVPS